MLKPFRGLVPGACFNGVGVGTVEEQRKVGWSIRLYAVSVPRRENLPQLCHVIHDGFKQMMSVKNTVKGKQVVEQRQRTQLDVTAWYA